jgi:hypothetical protein
MKIVMIGVVFVIFRDVFVEHTVNLLHAGHLPSLAYAEGRMLN